jgi:hypothetical protein
MDLTPLDQKCLQLVCNVNRNGNLKSENFQDYVQKPQRNCTFMNSASGDVAVDNISAGIFKQAMGARNRVGIGLSYRPARLHRLAG